MNHSAKSSQKSTQKSTQKSAEKTSEKHEEIVKKTSEKSAEKSVEKISQKSAEKIMDCMNDNPYIKTPELAEIIGISNSGIEKQIKRLKSKGMIKRVGPDKGGYWEVVTKDE